MVITNPDAIHQDENIRKPREQIALAPASQMLPNGLSAC